MPPRDHVPPRATWRKSFGPLSRLLYHIDRLTFQNGSVGQIRDRLKQNHRLQRLYHDLDIVAKHGRLRPERVKLVDSEHTIFVDPREPRGRAILRNFGRGQPSVKAIWRRAIDVLEPDLILDIGANYGEMVFAPTYPDSARVIAIEANTQLADFLERSRKAHTNADQIELVVALASDHSDDSATLYVDPTWSGRSSAAAASTEWVAQKIRAVRVDDLAGHTPSTLVFKIDVEGFEAQVLAGMARVLAADRVLGILEFHTITIERAGLDANAFLDSLHARFPAIAEVKRNGTITPIARDCPAERVQGDLVVATTPDLLEQAL